jgi:hypothetical protein
VYKFWSALVVVAIIVQVGAAGYGSFYVASKLDDKKDVPLSHKGFSHGWDFHAGFGYIVVLGLLIMLVLALIARLGRPWIWLPVTLAVLGIIQVLLAWIGSATPAVGVLHPINAFLILALAGANASRAWRTAPRPVTTPA